MNNFNTDLEYSLDISRNKDFDKFYYDIWQGQIKDIEYMDYETHKEEQLKGIDKKLILKNGKAVTIDEKCRRENYNDFFIELVSNTKTKKLGWLYYSTCDYIVYYVEPIRKAYLLPFELLKMAWIENKVEWKKKYPIRQCLNKGYISKGICIPTSILLDSISSQITKKY
jgi:hypothetical protein